LPFTYFGSPGPQCAQNWVVLVAGLFLAASALPTAATAIATVRARMIVRIEFFLPHGADELNVAVKTCG
jgi:hypothetical protein